MNLGEWLQTSGVRTEVADHADLTAELRGVTADSRRVQPGFVFVAMAGGRTHGLDFVPQALANGAIAVVTDRADWLENVLVIRVSDARQALGQLSAAFFGHPSQKLHVVGVTGTNGKTTTTVLIAQLLTSAGLKAAALGTTGIWTAAGTRPSALTTPDAEKLQETLANLLAEGFTHVAIEVSSHALDQQRVAGVRFAATVWTNLTRDHLDYHGTLEAYKEAKARLFGHELAAKFAFVNADDDACAQVWHAGKAQAWSLGAHGAAEHQVQQLECSAHGLTLTLKSQNHRDLPLHAPLIGRHNAENLTAAVLVCRALGVNDAVIQAGCAKLTAPRGRLQPIANHLGALVLVDYAHTPDALEKVLTALRPLVTAKGRLIVLFGCGGDRDPGKRPLMGQVAARLADLCVATSDNPRSEDPLAILAAVEEGLRMTGAQKLEKFVPSTLAQLQTGPRRSGYLLEPDREQAIRRAVGVLQPGDVLLIAGKGHETVQIVGHEERPFDDAAVVENYLGLTRKVEKPEMQRPSGFAFDGQTAHKATGGKLLVDARRWSTELCTDTRKLTQGALFVALPGETFDGGDFIGPALEAGAAGIVAGLNRAQPFAELAQQHNAWLVEVADPLVALGELARNHRLRFSPLVVGITGSNGKTTTKELTALALSPLAESLGRNVLWTAGNFNNRIGLPLTLARLNAQHHVAVLEMGMSVPGEIAQLAHMAVPKIGVVTSIAEAHLLGMGTVQAIVQEKMDLLRALPLSGIAIVPADEPLLQPIAKKLACKVLYFGRHAGDVRLASPISVQGLSQHFVADVAGTQVAVHLPGLGVHLAHNALAALAVAYAAGADLHAAAQALSRYEPVGQRMLPSQIGRFLVLEDCYNANPRSVEVALDTLATLPGPRVAILGSMLELGEREHELHARVGRHAAQQGIDVLIAVGNFAADYVRGAAEAGLAAKTAADPAEAAALVAKSVPGDATVLVKGSRGARMERAVAALRELTSPSSTPAARP